MNHLAELLQRYVEMYQAFQERPIGAPGSPARLLQKQQIELEEEAKLVLARNKRCIDDFMRKAGAP